MQTLKKVEAIADLYKSDADLKTKTDEILSRIITQYLMENYDQRLERLIEESLIELVGTYPDYFDVDLEEVIDQLRTVMYLSAGSEYRENLLELLTPVINEEYKKRGIIVD